MHKKLKPTQKKKIGALIRAHLNRNEIERFTTKNTELIGSAQELADKTNLAVETIYKLHSGEFSMKTLQKIEFVLGQSFLEQIEPNAFGDITKKADNHESDEGKEERPFRFGGYSKEQIEPYIGSFIAVRRSFSDRNDFFGTYFTIDWDDELGGAVFSEDNKSTSINGRIHDFSQSGTLHMSATTGTVHLLTSDQGAMRLITLSHLQMPEAVMFGIVLTQAVERGVYRPATSYIHFRKVLESHDSERALLGLINSAHKSYADVSEDLIEATNALSLC